MAIIGDALRQAFMQKHEYESLREEDRAWGKLQRPLLMAFIAAVCLVFLICTIISLNIVFPKDAANRPFCSDRRLQPLPVDVNGGDPDLFPGAFYLTDQETVDYYWMVVFIPSMIIFSVTVVYLIAGKVVLSFPLRFLQFEVVIFAKECMRKAIGILNLAFCISLGYLQKKNWPNLGINEVRTKNWNK